MMWFGVTMAQTSLSINMIEAAVTVLEAQKSEATLRVKFLESVAQKAAKRALSEEDVKEIYQGSNIVRSPIAVYRCPQDLNCRPVARSLSRKVPRRLEDAARPAYRLQVSFQAWADSVEDRPLTPAG